MNSPITPVDLREMLTLSFVSYLGFAEVGPPSWTDARIRAWMSEALRLLPLEGRWEIVWGPATETFPGTIFDENLMFVARRRDDPSKYAVVIRGTNPVSLANWILEDFSVLRQEPWPYGGSAAHPAPKLSWGATLGLQTLQRLKPIEGLPGAGLDLYRFLGHEIEASAAPPTVFITGHSLGGALSPALALWLEATRQVPDQPSSPPWDPGRRSALRVVSFAGPTPGNRDFAGLYDDAMGAVTDRVWSCLDVAPHAWDGELLGKLDGLYGAGIPPGPEIRLLISVARRLSERGEYGHCRREALPLRPEVCALLPSYLVQMVYQHTVGYVDALLTTRGAPEPPQELQERFAPGVRLLSAMVRESLRRVAGVDDALEQVFRDALPLDRSAAELGRRLIEIPGSALRALIRLRSPEAIRERGAYYQQRCRGEEAP